MKWWGIVLSVLLVASCGKPEEIDYQPSFSTQGSNKKQEYIVAIHPLHNPKRLTEIYGPIVEYINIRMPEIHLRLEASRSYEEFEKKLYTGRYDFAMPNPYQTLRSLKHGYRIFGKMGDDDDFRGIFLVRKDSNIHELADIKGKAVSYPAPTTLAGGMMNQYYLQTHGIDVKRDIKNSYVGSQDSVIMSVLRGHSAVGATWPVPWKAFSTEHPELASQLEVKWQTEPLPNNGWVVRQDVPAPVADKFAKLLFGLNDSAEGRSMLERLPVSRFEPATEETYRPVSEFLVLFSKTVRPIEY
jgi:phosphonate transport system substrate-binding protein